jgi:hypothetical protein
MDRHGQKLLIDCRDAPLADYGNYRWTGHKPGGGLLDLAPVLLGQIHF